MAFPTIVAVGDNAFTLHHTPTNKLMHWESLSPKVVPQCIVDVGPSYAGYASDTSRTLWLRSIGPSPWDPRYDMWKTAVETVEIALCNMIDTCVEGSPWSLVIDAFDKIASDVSAKALLYLREVQGKASASKITHNDIKAALTPHAVVHSVGLDVHDPLPTSSTWPNLKRHKSFRELRAGMCLALEPAFYFPAAGPVAEAFHPLLHGVAVRLETTLIVRSGPPEVLDLSVRRIWKERQSTQQISNHAPPPLSET